MTPAPHFTEKGLRFLRTLKRNNDREWFAERKELFDTEVKLPWLDVIEAINGELTDFAPDYVKPPRKAALRIYRDIRFSSDKKPYKDHMAAWWSTSTTERTSGGGFYAHVSGTEVFVAAGVYMPLPVQLLAIRRHLEQHHAVFRAMLTDRKLRALLPEFDSNPLTRIPKGFVAESPAADLLICRQWALRAILPAGIATSSRLVGEVAKRFRAVAPVVAFLNAPLLSEKAARKSFF